jgi:hypothetical protein
VIQPLRRAHYWTTLALALVVPGTFVAGLFARPRLKTETHLDRAPGAAVLGRQKIFRFQVDRISGNEARLRIFVEEPLAAPDVLVYYSPHAPQQGSLPDDAVFIGALDSSAYAVPASGSAILYSAAHATVLDELAYGASR